MRHSLAARGVKTGRKKIIGRYADKWPQSKNRKPLLQQVETDPNKRWFWGIKFKPKDKKEIIKEGLRSLATEPQKPPEPVAKPEAPPAVQETKAPPKSAPRKSSGPKFKSVEEAWEAAQQELANRYGEDSSSTGVVKNDKEAEERLAKQMGLH